MSIVADADRLLEIARQTLGGYAGDSSEYKSLTEAASCLRGSCFKISNARLIQSKRASSRK